MAASGGADRRRVATLLPAAMVDLPAPMTRRSQPWPAFERGEFGAWCTRVAHRTGRVSHRDQADRDAALDAAFLVEARHAAGASNLSVARGLAEPELIDWSPFGLVLPVLSASAGDGASVVAATVADAAQAAGRSVLMVDTADPVRSGLNRAAMVDGPRPSVGQRSVAVRYSWRDQVVLAQAESSSPVLAPAMMPPPRDWLPRERQPDLTVVDVGHDPWRVTAAPVAGAGEWLRTGSPSPRPLLVVRPTVPSLARAEQVLARLTPWVRLGIATPPTQLVVVGARRWPKVVAASAGRRTSVLVPDALFLPHDPAIERHGITAAPMPRRLQAPVERLLMRWTPLPGNSSV